MIWLLLLAAVTATVPNRTRPDTPVLISPANNATMATTAPTFIFNPANGETRVSRYELWIDGVKNTDEIPQSFSTITTQALAALAQGTHTWMIKAIGTNYTDRDSAIWTFTIDTTAPLILVDQVAEHETNLSSLDLTPFQNQIIFSTSDRYPLISGQSESDATLSIIINNETVTARVGSDRLFSLKPKTALPLGRFAVSAAASDAAGNNTSLPSFYLDIVSGAGLITIPLPSPLPDLKFTVPVVVPSTLAPVTLLPFIPAAPAKLNYLIWLIIITYLCHIYCLNRFIRRLYLHHSIKNIHFIFIYITITLPTLSLAVLALAAKHWLTGLLAFLSLIIVIFEFRLNRSKHIIIEQ